MAKDHLCYIIGLVALQTAFFIIGNPTQPGGLSSYPFWLGLISFPLVLMLQLHAIFRRDPGLAFGRAFWVCESTVRFAALFYGIFVFVYACFYYRAKSAAILVLLAFSFLGTVLSSWVIGTLFLLPCAFVMRKFAKARHR
jgi:hypothetical protein